jgi:5-methylthioadenosine/S-adenosylhomocysteine deaminase
MATLHGARALGLGDRLGAIEPGKQASLAVLPLPSSARDPLAWVCSRPSEVHALRSAPSVRA